MSEETYGRRLYLAALVVVVALSVAGNAVFAYSAPASSEMTLSPGWAAAAHTIPPALLLLVTEVLAVASSKFSGRGRAWALAGVVVVAAAAFVLSFDALREVALMAKVRPELAWLVPVMLDVAIVVCTTLVLMASRQIQRDRAAALMGAAAEELVVTRVPVRAEATETTRTSEPVAQVDQGREPVTVAEVDQPEPVTIVAVETTGAAGTGDQEPDAVSEQVNGHDQAAASVVTMSDWAASHEPVQVPAVTGEPEITDQLEVADQTGEPGETDQASRGGSVTTMITDKPVTAEVDPVTGDHGPGELSPDWSVELGEDADGLTELGAMVRAELSTDATADQIGRALGLVRAGESRRKVADAVGIGSHNTIKRWVDAAVRLDAQYRAAVVV